jgi:hypothetical protein
MKVVLEFGVRGGPFAESIILPSQKLGAEMASNLVRVLSGNNDNSIGRKAQWNVRKNLPRKSWQSSSHFVSLSILDGEPRGPASAQLWKKNNVTL